MRALSDICTHGDCGGPGSPVHSAASATGTNAPSPWPRSWRDAGAPDDAGGVLGGRPEPKSASRSRFTLQEYSTRGGRFDVLRYGRFLEVFAYCSPAHAYSVHTTFLGLFAVLRRSNDALKREAVARLEAGELLAFGVSEREHGSHLMAGACRTRRRL